MELRVPTLLLTRVCGRPRRAQAHFMGGTGIGTLVAVAVCNFLAGLILGSPRRDAAPPSSNDCAAEDRCLERLEQGARFRLVLELGLGSALLLLCALGVRSLACGRCRGRRVGAATPAAQPAAVPLASAAQPLPSAPSASAQPAPVGGIFLAAAAPSGASGSAGESNVYVPRRTRGKQPPP